MLAKLHCSRNSNRISFTPLSSQRELKLYRVNPRAFNVPPRTSFHFPIKLFPTVFVTHIYCGSVSVSYARVIKTFPFSTISDELLFLFQPQRRGMEDGEHISCRCRLLSLFLEQVSICSIRFVLQQTSYCIT